VQVLTTVTKRLKISKAKKKPNLYLKAAKTCKVFEPKHFTTDLGCFSYFLLRTAIFKKDCPKKYYCSNIDFKGEEGGG